MKCPNGCHVRMEAEKVERLYHKDGEPIVIRDLLIEVCPECGQEAIPLASMRIVDTIIKGKSQAVGTLEAPVYQAV